MPIIEGLVIDPFGPEITFAKKPQFDHGTITWQFWFNGNPIVRETRLAEIRGKKKQPNAGSVLESRMTPLLSVVMPTYNGERFIAAALESVRDQHDDGIELVIVDDGSTDRTLDIVRDFADALPDSADYSRKAWELGGRQQSRSA